MKKGKLAFWGCALLVILAVAVLLSVTLRGDRITPASSTKLVFQGDYRIGDGEWKPIKQGKHIPATKGDVTLKGALYIVSSDGETDAPAVDDLRIAMYLNHLGMEIHTGTDRIMMATETPAYGNAGCGKHWAYYDLSAESAKDLQIVLKNSHRFGNGIAVDDFLDSLYVDTGAQFQSEQMHKDAAISTIGFFMMIVAIILIGVGVFSAFLQLDYVGIMWLVGVITFFGGGFYVMSAKSIHLWFDQIAFTTGALLLCMMLYTVFLQILVHKSLIYSSKTVGLLTVVVSGVLTAAIFVASIVSKTRLYDLMMIWTIGQCVLNGFLLALCVHSAFHIQKHVRILCIGFSLALFAFLGDALGTAVGAWQGGLLSRIVFLLIFSSALIMALRMLPRNIRAAVKSQEIKTELERSKTAITLSQIQPHFLYNSLGAIRELCIQDPEEAREALSIFITYLRGNMDSLKSERPIPFTKELSHIETYLKLEKLRFSSDLRVVYDIRDNDFFLPSLTIQPLVENAVKHGVCGKEEGGTINIRTRREDRKIIIEIQDDGIGFDTNQVLDGKHIGIQNVRNRLEHMVGGELHIISEPGVGTLATVILHI